MSVRYLLDENVDPRFRVALKRVDSDIEVWMVGDPGAPSLGTLDPDIQDWCERHQLVLVTHNRASTPVHLRDHLAQGQHSPVIFVIRPRTLLTAIVEELALVSGTGQTEE